MRPFQAPLIAALLVAVLALAGCGSTSDSSTVGGAGASTPDPSAPGGEAEAQAPKGASPVLREIYRQFPQPQPNPEVRASGAAITAGMKACRGKTPLQVKDAFYPLAVEAGGIRPDSPQGEMIAEVASFEADSARDAGFTAGQLAAAAYEAAQPPATARFGYRGCIYSLARELERKLAAK